MAPLSAPPVRTKPFPTVLALHPLKVNALDERTNAHQLANERCHGSRSSVVLHSPALYFGNR
jgi:hypothetical protein